MHQTTDFLALYREYESLLREQGLEYKQIEDNAEGQTQDRMRICRQLRNYLVHQEDAGFLEISEKQMAFFRGLVETEKTKLDTFGEHLLSLRSGACTPEDSPEAVLKKMKRLKTCVLPIWEIKESSLRKDIPHWTACKDDTYRIEALLGQITLIHVALLLAKGSETIGSGLKRYEKPDVILRPDTRMPEALNFAEASPLICCTEDGTMKSGFLGAYIRENGRW